MEKIKRREILFSQKLNNYDKLKIEREKKWQFRIRGRKLKKEKE